MAWSKYGSIDPAKSDITTVLFIRSSLYDASSKLVHRALQFCLTQKIFGSNNSMCLYLGVSRVCNHHVLYRSLDFCCLCKSCLTISRSSTNDDCLVLHSTQSIPSVAVVDRHLFVRCEYDWSYHSNHCLLRYYHLPTNKHASTKTSVVVRYLHRRNFIRTSIARNERKIHSEQQR